MKNFDSYQFPTSHTVRAIHEDQQGNLWFATDGNGVLRYYDGHFEHLTIETGLPEDHNFFTKILEDREKSLWFVGDGGLLRIKDNKFTTFGRNEGFTSNFGHTVCEDRAGNIGAGFRNGGLVMFDRDTVRTWEAEDGDATDAIEGGNINIHSDGASKANGQEELASEAIPERYMLEQNCPNPFNPTTEIVFALPEAGKATVCIYSETGQLVRTLVDNEMQAGRHVVSWNGLNESGNTVAAGVYLYRIVVQRQNDETAFTETRRMTLLK